MSQPSVVHAGSPRPRSAALGLLPASRRLTASWPVLSVHGVSTTRAAHHIGATAEVIAGLGPAARRRPACAPKRADPPVDRAAARHCPGLVGGAASSILPGYDVAAAFSWLLVGGAGLPTNRFALCAVPVQPCLDPLGAAPGFLLGRPACERDQDILDLRGRVQPGFLDRDRDAAAVLELADQPERSFGARRG